MMNIFDFALDMVKESENLYRELMNETDNIGMKNILNMLADDEVKHYKAIQNAVKNLDNTSFADTKVLESGINIIKKFSINNDDIGISQKQLTIYKKAQQIELKSKNFYQEKADEASLPEHKSLLQWLALEEEKHYNLLDNIIIHVSRSETWVESAEFTTREEY